VPSTAFFCVADKRHFIGAVALVNSLRMCGHQQPIYILDCGLDAAQRGLLAGEATIVDGQESTSPHLLKWIAPLRHPADLMVLADADIIVVRSLDPILQQAAAGNVVAFCDALASRHDPRWETLLNLPPLRRQAYVNSGLVAFPRELGTGLLEDLRSLADRVDVDRSMVGHGVPSDPLYYLDQDVLNALLATRIEGKNICALEHRLAPHPPFRGLEITDANLLRCQYSDGTEPMVLHHIQRKPWLSPTPSNAYSRLLTRLLVAPDLPLRVPPTTIPLRLREGTLASIDRRWISVRNAVTQGRRSLGIRRRSPAGSS
jgi:hypothetical protein